MGSWIERKSEYEEIARQIEPSAKLTTKDAWPWKVLAAIVHCVTFRGISYSEFLSHYATTIGPIQAYPAAWPTLQERTIVHESEHVRQCRWCGFGLHPWVGLPFYALLYVFLPLPLGLAWFRFRFELAAERASYRHMFARGYAPLIIRTRAREFGQTVCSARYGWAWPRGAAAFERAAEIELEAKLEK